MANLNIIYSKREKLNRLVLIIQKKGANVITNNKPDKNGFILKQDFFENVCSLLKYYVVLLALV